MHLNTSLKAVQNKERIVWVYSTEVTLLLLNLCLSTGIFCWHPLLKFILSNMQYYDKVKPHSFKQVGIRMLFHVSLLEAIAL